MHSSNLWWSTSQPRRGPIPASEQTIIMPGGSISDSWRVFSFSPATYVIIWVCVPCGFAASLSREPGGSATYTLGPTMANERQSGGLDGIARAARREAGRGLPPVHLWNPPFCGELDMRIASDDRLPENPHRPSRHGSRSCSGRRIAVLLAPPEKCGITVDDAPSWRRDAGRGGRGGLHSAPMSTTGCVRSDHACAGSSPAPRVKPTARAAHLGRVTRALFYDLPNSASATQAGAYWRRPGGEFFVAAPADSLKEFA